MKKKLSFILALVFILTLAFGTVINASATPSPQPPQPGTLIVTKSVPGENVTTEEFSVTVTFTGKDWNTDLSGITSNGLTGVATQGQHYNPTIKPTLVFTFSISEATGNVIFTGIPYNTSYSVSEDNLTPAQISAGWAKNGIAYEDNDQKIDSSSDTDTVTVKNTFTPPFGTLTVTKEVTTKGPSDVKFPISVQFTLPSGERTQEETDAMYLAIANSGNLTSTVDGAYILQLSKDESVMFSNIPQGTSYVVVEDLTGTSLETAGWEKDNIIYSKDHNQISMAIECAGDDDSVTVKNKYIYGMLEVKKDVVTDGAPTTGVTFPVTVKFSGENDLSTITNSANISPDETGLYNLALADDASVMFYGIPDNTIYTVVESDSLGAGWARDGYIDEDYGSGDHKNNGIGKANSGVTDCVTVKNKYTLGMLTVTKDIPDTAPMNVPFPFTVTFTNHDNNYSTITNSAGVTATSDGVYNFNLTGDQSITFYGIPDNTIYTYVEDLSNTNYASAGWHFNGYSDEDYGYGDDANDGKGKIDFCDNKIDTDSVKIINKYCAPDTGKLTVKKIVTTPEVQTYSIPDEEFKITVTFTNDNPYMDLSGIKLDGTQVIFDAGTTNTVTVTLKGGESAVFTNIPKGTVYAVTEQSTQNWLEPVIWCDDSKENNSPEPYYTIDSNNDDDTVTVTNRFDPRGELIVDKDVSEGDPTNQEFTMTVVFTGTNLNEIKAGELEGTANSEAGTMTFTFTLTGASDPKVFSNIPLGVSYTVTESGIPANWSQVSVIVNGSAFASGETYSFSYENVEINHLSDTVVITNDYTAPGGTTENPGTPVYIPTTTTTPSESPSESPSTEPSSDVAGASDDGSSTNNGDDQTGVLGDSDVLPQTGGISTATLLGIFGLALIAIGGTALTIFKKKSDSKNKSK